MKTILVLFGMVLLLVVPSPGLADSDSDEPAARPDATLYEVTETVSFDLHRIIECPPAPDAGSPDQQVVFRNAVASLLGTVSVGTPLCPAGVLVTDPEALTCTVTGVGRSSVSTADGEGCASGTFAVVVNARGNSSVHVPDLPVLEGTFSGDVDLSRAVLLGIPLGSITGSFTIERDQTGQGLAGQELPFLGTFRLPFSRDPEGNIGKPVEEQNTYYLGDDLRRFAVKPKERTLGFPAVRLEVTFSR